MTFVDGRQHDFWRVDEERLRAALASDALELTRPGPAASPRTECDAGRPC